MLLSALDNSKGRFKVFLLQTPSDKLRLYLYDRIKEDYNCNKDTILELKDKKDLKKIKEIAYIDSFMSDKWLVTCNIKSVSSFMKEFVELIYESTTIIFFCTADNYRTFKNFTTALKNKGVTEVYQYYLTSLRSADFAYLYGKHVTKNNKLTKQLYDFVYQGYNSNISALMELFEELQRGTEFQSRKDISEVCGVGGNSVESFIFSMLKDPPSTEMGTKTVLKNRLKAGLDLVSIYGVKRFQSYLSACLSSFIDLKMLLISGTIYKKVINLPKGYDEAKLIKYQRFIWRIKPIPTTRLLRLANFLQQKSWTNELDFVRFVYGYLLDAIRYEVLPYMTKTTVEDEYIIAKRKEEEAAKEAAIEEAKWETQRRLEYIKKYGIIRGRELFEQEKQRGVSSSKSVKSDKGAKSSSAKKGSKNFTGNESADEAAAMFRELIANH